MAEFLKTMQSKPGFVAMASATEDQVKEAETQLGVLFAKDYKAYVQAYGVAAYDGHELTGISKSPRLSVINATLEERKNNPDMPSDWYVIEQLNIDDVSIWQSGTGEVFQVMPGLSPTKIYDSLVKYVES